MAKGKAGRPKKKVEPVKKIQLKLQVPETLADITVRQYMKFRKYDVSSASEPEFVARKVLETFYDVDSKISNNISNIDYNHLVVTVLRMLDTKPSLIRRFTLEGVEFGLIPNIDKITFGEFVDIKSIKSDDFNKMMAIVYRPIVKEKNGRYKIEPYRGYTLYEDAMMDAPLDVLYGVFTFFLTLSKNMMNSILNSTKKNLKKALQNQKRKQTSQISGDGIQALFKSVENQYSILTKQQSYLHIKF